MKNIPFIVRWLNKQKRKGKLMEKVCTFCGKKGVMQVMSNEDPFCNTACLLAYWDACVKANNQYYRQQQLFLERHFPEVPRVALETEL